MKPMWSGLPLIDTIKLLHLSGEISPKLKGFPGTLSYLLIISLQRMFRLAKY
jgi:hypothetical protein